jgi:hypothetical protein
MIKRMTEEYVKRVNGVYWGAIFDSAAFITTGG